MYYVPRYTNDMLVSKNGPSILALGTCANQLRFILHDFNIVFDSSTLSANDVAIFKWISTYSLGFLHDILHVPHML